MGTWLLMGLPQGQQVQAGLRSARTTWTGAVAEYLIDVVEGGAFVWPVVVALPDTILRQGRQHDDHHAATLPHHLHTEKARGHSVTGWSPCGTCSHCTRDSPNLFHPLETYFIPITLLFCGCFMSLNMPALYFACSMQY